MQWGKLEGRETCFQKKQNKMPPARKNWTRDSVEGIARLINDPPATSVINPLATTIGDDSELSKTMSIYWAIIFPSF